MDIMRSHGRDMGLTADQGSPRRRGMLLDDDSDVSDQLLSPAGDDGWDFTGLQASDMGDKATVPLARPRVWLDEDLERAIQEVRESAEQAQAQVNILRTKITLRNLAFEKERTKDFGSQDQDAVAEMEREWEQKARGWDMTALAPFRALAAGRKKWNSGILASREKLTGLSLDLAAFPGILEKRLKDTGVWPSVAELEELRRMREIQTGLRPTEDKTAGFFRPDQIMRGMPALKTQRELDDYLARYDGFKRAAKKYVATMWHPSIGDQTPDEWVREISKEFWLDRVWLVNRFVSLEAEFGRFTDKDWSWGRELCEKVLLDLPGIRDYPSIGLWVLEGGPGWAMRVLRPMFVSSRARMGGLATSYKAHTDAARRTAVKTDMAEARGRFEEEFR